MASEHTTESEATESAHEEVTPASEPPSHNALGRNRARGREPEEDAVEPHLMHRAMAEEEDMRVAEVAEHRT